MTTIGAIIERSDGGLGASLHEHWQLFLVEGFILIALGAAAVALPQVATFAIEAIVGWVLLLSGLIGLVSTWWMRRLPGVWWSLLSALVATTAGAVLLGWPLGGVLSLTAVLVVFFVVEGVASILYAIEHRRHGAGRSVWLLVSGAIDLMLAALIVIGLPGTAAWAIGLLVGVNMVFGGVALAGMALSARTTPVPLTRPS
jgi:uncharacterized membrane protein HdeD (DUF308 family)